ncbi:MAG: hypothetical protein GTO12_12785 [Proteobacteria bacterium]|nr:hypothetical protein [Pseudomonadota bacterium]
MALWERSKVEIDEGADFYLLSEPEFVDLFGEIVQTVRPRLFATILITDGPGTGLADELVFGG